MIGSSTPGLSEFDPGRIPWQEVALNEIRQDYDYGQGVHEVLLSGSIGSAKSILMAHLVVTHCIFNRGARVCLGRRSQPDLKDTIFKKIIEHLQNDPKIIRGVHWDFTVHPLRIWFCNASEIISRSWADKNYEKFRSLELSMGVVEELTENDDDDFYKEFRARVGRLPHVREALMLCATNPGDPEHWAYDYFIEGAKKIPTRHVYYSVTEDNPFLPSWYIGQLYSMYDEKEALRMLKGQWIPIRGDTIYHAYDDAVNFRNRVYKVDENHPVSLNFDFNIALGKPMSCVLDQQVNDEYHFFREVIVHGARTMDVMDELAASSILEFDVEWLVHGDAAGRSRDTRSIQTDYDIIFEFLENYRTKKGRPLNFTRDRGDCVPIKNPPIRERHNRMNAAMKNARGKSRLFVYAGAPMLHKGFKLTKLRDGAQYVEDDSKEYQHCTTAAGYRVCYTEDTHEGMQDTGTQEL